ncbi:hypothetical protein J6590_047577 [Homalodisca vitripennis]|nr:hypothetical protein J6590_047577 [Homalodisca vitripennis]
MYIIDDTYHRIPGQTTTGTAFVTAADVTRYSDVHYRRHLPQDIRPDHNWNRFCEPRLRSSGSKNGPGIRRKNASPSLIIFVRSAPISPSDYGACEAIKTVSGSPCEALYLSPILACPYYYTPAWIR